MKTIAELQTFLGVAADGRWGVKSKAALDAVLAGAAEPPSGEVDPRSEKAIATLHPNVRPLARKLIRKAADSGIIIKIISGTRTYAEQNALYEQGRTKPGNIVTNARGGYSNHGFGIAFDVGVFSAQSGYIPESPSYKVVGALGKALGLSWGGDWKTIKDEPHFELHPEWAKGMSESAMLTELRRRKAEGIDAFA